MDRFDLRIEVPPVAYTDLDLPQDGDTSQAIAARVAAAHALQDARYADDITTWSNADAEGKVLERVATPNSAGRTLLQRVAEKFGLSARGYHRVLRVARTIADLAGSDQVMSNHVAEAVSYRVAA